MTIDSSALGTALAFAHHSFRVLPLHHPVDRGGRLVCSCHRGPECPSPAKHPIGRHEKLGAVAPNGLNSATAESGTVRHWFSSLPDANLGVCVDKDRFALDIDPKRDGDESLATLEKQRGLLPRTWRTITGSGGEHIIFRLPAGLELPRFAYNPQAPETSQPLGLGIDAPFYVVSPPSRHISGRAYAWSVDHHPADVPLAEPPAWLVNRLVEAKASGHSTSHGERTPPEEWLRLVSPEACISEYRDMAAAKVAGHLLRRFVEPALAWGLLHAWNTTYCRPPLSAFELRRILDRILEREAARRARTDTAVNESELASIAATLGVAR